MRVVGLMLLAAVMLSVVLPWFDLHPTCVRPSPRMLRHAGPAAPAFLLGAVFAFSHRLSDSSWVRQSKWADDIVARDCARIC